LKNRFGSKNYAAEELVAELCAAFLCAEFGFDGDLRHAGYIEHWIELLKADKRAFFTACSQASKAADYLRGLALAEPTRGPTHYGGKLAPHCRSGNNRRYAELPTGPNVQRAIAPADAKQPVKPYPLNRLCGGRSRSPVEAEPGLVVR